jgi:flagellar basal body-associated protein FliL
MKMKKERKKSRMNVLIMILVIVIVDALFLGYNVIQKHDKKSSASSEIPTALIIQVPTNHLPTLD